MNVTGRTRIASPADLAGRLVETAERRPDAAALIWRDRTITYGELTDRVARAAGGLRALGVGHGDRVALLLGNSPVFVETFVASLRAGATAVPMNTGLAPREIRHILADSGARVLVVDDEILPAVEAAVGDDRPPHLEHIVVSDGEQGDRSSWSDLCARDAPTDEVARDPSDIAALVYTSGTTGTPKGAMLTRHNLATNQDQVLATRLGLREDDVVLAVLPLFHIYAMNVGLGTAVRVGATLVLAERFDPVATLEQIARHGVTVLLGAPPMYVAWLTTPGLDRTDLSTVRAAVSGAAPLPAAVLEGFREAFGVPIWEGYGLTEAAPAVTSTAMGPVAKAGSVGLPLPGVEVRLVDEDGRDVEIGDPGEVWVRGENVFAGYWNDEEATRAVLTADGWLRTGDVGMREADGYLRLVDRRTDVIIVSGFNVYPREVENALNEHPDVAAAAVVGVPHLYTGEAVKAFVVPQPGAEPDEDDLIAWTKDLLARFKCPETVEIVDRLPYTATGKVKRHHLREGSG